MKAAERLGQTTLCSYEKMFAQMRRMCLERGCVIGMRNSQVRVYRVADAVLSSKVLQISQNSQNDRVARGRDFLA